MEAGYVHNALIFKRLRYAQVLGATSFSFGALQRGGEVGDEVIDVLDTDAEAQHVRVYACRYLFLRAEL